jgi:peptide/nickel transport system permease protein
MRQISLQFWLGISLTGLVLTAGLLSQIWTPYPIDEISILNRLQTPSTTYWLGTDMFGRDIFSRILGGAWTALCVGSSAVILGLAGGVPLGLVAAIHRGGILDDCIARGVDLIFAFPALLTAVLMAAVYGPGSINVIVAAGIFNIAVFARVVRGATLSIIARPFLISAIALGQPRRKVILKHVLPNIAGGVAVQATVQFSIAILIEAGLSFLGLGARPPTPSWGKMLADAQTLIYIDPMQAIFPGLAILVAVLGLNLLGDGLRDLLDPRLRISGARHDGAFLRKDENPQTPSGTKPVPRG